MDIRDFQAGFSVFILLFISTLDWIMPTLTRRGLFFGVTVAPAVRESAAGRSILVRYRLSIIIIDVLMLVALALLLLLAPVDWWRGSLSALFIIVPTLLLTLPYLIAHFASKALASEGQPGATYPPQPDTAPAAELRPRHYSDYVPLIWELLPLGLIATTVAYLASQYSIAPALIATHFDAAGNVNGYTTKSIGSFFLLVWVQLFIYILLTTLNVLTVGARTVPGGADERFRRIWLRMLFGFKVYLIALMGFLAIVIAQAANLTHFTADWLLPTMLGSVILLLLVTLLVSLRTGQGGSRLAVGSETATDRLNDRYWKLGTIYVNANDPSIFVERRFGIGWTINFGNPRAIAVFVVILVLPITFAIVSIVLTGTTHHGIIR